MFYTSQGVQDFFHQPYLLRFGVLGLFLGRFEYLLNVCVWKPRVVTVDNEDGGCNQPSWKICASQIGSFSQPSRGVKRKTHRFQNLRIIANLKLQYHMCPTNGLCVFFIKKKLSTKKNSHSKNAVLQKLGCGNSFLAPRYEEIFVPGKQPLLFNSINLKRREKTTSV